MLMERYDIDAAAAFGLLVQLYGLIYSKNAASCRKP